MRWHLSRDLHFLPDGRHCVPFPQTLSLTLLYYNFSAEYRLAPSYHDYLEISYIYKGKGVFHVGNQRRNVGEGDVLLVGNSLMHRLEAVRGDSLKVICVYFMPELIRSEGMLGWQSMYAGLFGRPLSGNSGIAVYSDTNGGVLKAIQAIQAEIDAKTDYYELAVQVHLLRALLPILRSSGVQMVSAKRGSYEQCDKVRRLEPVFSYVHAHYHEKISNAQLARAAYMSPSYFCRFFKKTTGMTPTDYIHRIRIDAAKQILLQTEMSITEVAYKVGFESHSYFDSVFRRLTGFTPGDLQRALRGDEHCP